MIPSQQMINFKMMRIFFFNSKHVVGECVRDLVIFCGVISLDTEFCNLAMLTDVSKPWISKEQM